MKQSQLARTESAHLRKLARAKLTKRQQLAALDTRPGNAKRERARLAA